MLTVLSWLMVVLPGNGDHQLDNRRPSLESGKDAMVLGVWSLMSNCISCVTRIVSLWLTTGIHTRMSGSLLK
jgi:hypothetical protein